MSPFDHQGGKLGRCANDYGGVSMMRNRIERIFSGAEKVLFVGSCTSILIIMFLTTFDLLARKFYDYAIPSLYEFTEDYLMVSLVFLSISTVFLKGGHVRVTLFEKYIPERFRSRVAQILKVSAFILFFLITIKGWEVTVRAYQFGEVSSSVLAYPLAPAFFLVPLGCAFLCIRIVQSFFVSFETQEGRDH